LAFALQLLIFKFLPEFPLKLPVISQMEIPEIFHRKFPFNMFLNKNCNIKRYTNPFGAKTVKVVDQPFLASIGCNNLTLFSCAVK